MSKACFFGFVQHHRVCAFTHVYVLKWWRINMSETQHVRNIKSELVRRVYVHLLCI